MRFLFPWPQLDPVRLAALLAEVVAAAGNGVVATPDRQLLDPDPDACVRPGYREPIAGELTWHVGFPTRSRRAGERYFWGTIRFSMQGGRCAGQFEERDFDAEREEEFLAIVHAVIAKLAGEIA